MRRAAPVVAGVVFALAALLACQPAPPVAAPSPAASLSPSSSPSASPAASPSPSVRPTPTPSRSPGSSTPADQLRPGGHGPQVLDLQRRLVALGYWLGTPNGVYGSSTTHAVTAFQKAAGLKRDGIAGRTTRTALDRATRLSPRSTSGTLIEIDLHRQLLLVVSGGRVRWVLDTSTGAVAGTTPRGRFTVDRQVDGYRYAPLGVLYRPKYFHDGVAVHGFTTVPPYPASHGCVRVTYAAMDWLWSSGSMPLGSHVWVY
jgi:lipoprotein-anchoring transpeptidase ErfK/SrfK